MSRCRARLGRHWAAFRSSLPSRPRSGASRTEWAAAAPGRRGDRPARAYRTELPARPCRRARQPAAWLSPGRLGAEHPGAAVLLAELFPTPVRSTALAITYGLATALVGGTAPFLDTLLVRRTGNPLVPAYYATAITLAAAVALLLTRETAFQPLDADEDRRARPRRPRLGRAHDG